MHARAMMKIFDASPMPNHRMASGKSASGEIGRSSSTSGSKISFISGDARHRACRVATPTSTAMAKPQMTRTRLGVERLRQIAADEQFAQIGEGPLLGGGNSSVVQEAAAARPVPRLPARGTAPSRMSIASLQQGATSRRDATAGSSRMTRPGQADLVAPRSQTLGLCAMTTTRSAMITASSMSCVTKTTRLLGRPPRCAGPRAASLRRVSASSAASGSSISNNLWVNGERTGDFERAGACRPTDRWDTARAKPVELHQPQQLEDGICDIAPLPPVGLKLQPVGDIFLPPSASGNSAGCWNTILRSRDLPSIWWTPMLGFRARRTVSDECDAPDNSRRVQTRGG